jgi:hypothetical protein
MKFVKTIATIAASMYIGAGLSLGLVMAQVLPLTVLGVSVYAVTWPYSVYCARPGADCFASADFVPEWLAIRMFDIE